jgi:hypothetical protein
MPSAFPWRRRCYSDCGAIKNAVWLRRRISAIGGGCRDRNRKCRAGRGGFPARRGAVRLYAAGHQDGGSTTMNVPRKPRLSGRRSNAASKGVRLTARKPVLARTSARHSSNRPTRWRSRSPITRSAKRKPGKSSWCTRQRSFRRPATGDAAGGSDCVQQDADRRHLLLSGVDEAKPLRPAKRKEAE